jgi:hypothetical protein
MSNPKDAPPRRLDPTKAEYWVTTWHNFTINDATRLFLVGKGTSRLSHYCTFELTDFRRMQANPGKTQTSVELSMYQPTNFSVPCAFCKFCNILFVARDPDERR